MKNYTRIDSAQGTTVYTPAQDITLPQQPQAGAAGFTISHVDLEEILEYLNIWVVPLVNPGGRNEQLHPWNPFGADIYAGRPNPAGVCINRNFYTGFYFKQLFSVAGYGHFLNSMSPNKDDPGDPANHYQGKKPASEKETKTLVKLLCQNVTAPNVIGDPSITWLFDIHGQDAYNCKVSYPWSWAETQTQLPKMCIGNKAYDPPSPPNPVVREGVVDLAKNPNAYGEYLPPATAKDLADLAGIFTSAAEQCYGTPWATQGAQKYTWEQPGQGGGLYPCVGAVDDYFLWLDRNHCRAFTVECAWLQPPDDDIKDREKDMVAAGLFAALRTIKNSIKNSADVREDLSRLSKNQLKCP